MQKQISYFGSAFLVAALAANSAQADDEDEPEGGIGIGYFSRLSAQVSAVDIAPEENETGMYPNEYDSSTPIKLSIDLAGMYLPSVNKNLHGFEMQGSISLFPFDLDVWGGTAVTMLGIGSGGIGTIRVRGGFGLGMSYNHSYAYLKSQIAAVIVPDKVSVEASVFWIPNQVSIAWGDRDGDFDEQRRRASVFVDLGDDKKKFEIYVEQVDRQRGGHDKDYMAVRENFTTRDPADDMLGIGIGASLMLEMD